MFRTCALLASYGGQALLALFSLLTIGLRAPLILNIGLKGLKKRQLNVRERLANHSPTAYWDRKDRNPPRVEGTCDWFVNHKLFDEWRTWKSSRMLWVSADPGCGKSVLARYLVDEVLQSDSSRTTCYFFFKDDFPDQKNITSALCCILHQLFEQKPDLLSEAIIEKFEGGGESFINSFSQLWLTLSRASAQSDAGEIVCILDAIDECEDKGRVQLSKAMCNLYRATADDFKLKFLLLSRPYAKIRMSFQTLKAPDLPNIHLSGDSEEEVEKISREIDIFIEVKIKDIAFTKGLRAEHQNDLLMGFRKVNHRTYLWVYLTLQLIEEEINIDAKRISEAMSRLPQTVYDAYDRILSKSKDFAQARKLLQIVIAAERPLTLEEMAVALTLKENDRSYQGLELSMKDTFLEYVRDLCSLFISVVDSRIYLLHQTAREFLLQKNMDYSSLSLTSWQHSFLPSDCHQILAWICIRYLHFEEFQTEPSGSPRELQFFDYSAQYWATHVRQSRLQLDKIAKRYIFRLCDQRSPICGTWFRAYWDITNQVFPSGFTNLMRASCCGLAIIVAEMLEGDQGEYLSSKDDNYGRSALSWAAGNGFPDVVRLLVKYIRKKELWLPIEILKWTGRKRELESRDVDDRTPLCHAVWNKQAAVVEILLQFGAHAEPEDRIGGTPFVYAVISGDQDTLKPFLESGVEANLQPNSIRTILFSAVRSGDERAVSMLLETGKVSPDMEDENFLRPLCLAIGAQRYIVAVLLEHGAEVNFVYAVKEHEHILHINNTVLCGLVNQTTQNYIVCNITYLLACVMVSPDYLCYSPGPACAA
ncbi:hypothetical protein ABW20_dc0105302 [Dactylellina cionopaga]|nr:hypothetical protein ABW20_dc0105302 [Dactylellina cionopaga]